MKTNSTQRSVATALVHLLTEHPELSESISWTIGRTRPSLFGFAHDGGMEVLAHCASIVGGSIEADGQYKHNGHAVQQMALRSVWRDVPVEVSVVLPVQATAVAA